MTRVDVEEVRALKARLAEINSHDFDDIEWFENNKLLVVDPVIASTWHFIGMTNADFITSDYYKQ